MQSKRFATLLLATVALVVSGCAGRRLIDAPYVMRNDAAKARYDALSPALQTPDVPVLYVTNRKVDKETVTGPKYGYKRSTDMAYGIATVHMTPEPTWAELVDDSVHAPRGKNYHISVSKVEPVGVVRPTMEYTSIENGRIALAPDAVAPILAERDTFDALFDRWFGEGGSGDAYLFVHGYNNTFDAAVFRVAETWHFSGRPGLPICFTWPAGSGGLKGYAYDRESGEFSVVPLKSLIWMLAASPRIKAIHIISHSRGTDVAITALREIQFEIRGLYRRSIYAPLTGQAFSPTVLPGQEVYEALKLRTLVLASPDMDIDVFGQRFLNEGLIQVADRVVVYTSESDKALGLSNWLFRGRSRLGDMRLTSINPKTLSILSQLDKLELINCKVRGGDSHGYLFQHPAALSDLILLLRDDLVPGPDEGRPLKRANEGVWELPNDYLKPIP